MDSFGENLPEVLVALFEAHRETAIRVGFGVLAIATAMIAFFIGRSMGFSADAEARAALEQERDTLSNELSEAKLDFRDLDAARRDLEEEASKLRELLGRRALEAERHEAKTDAIVAKSQRLGGEYESYRTRIRAAVDGEIWTRALKEADQVKHLARRSAIPIIAVGNFKGGVGKTTIAANLGAYFADAQPDGDRAPRRVLFVDLDFQGSLSSILVSVADGEIENRVVSVFEDDPVTPEEMVSVVAAPLEARGFRPGSRFLDCDYAAAAQEERYLFDWVSAEQTGADLRLKLSGFLYSRAVQNSFDVVMIDMPPRNSTFSFNALAAATHLIVATRHDVLSAEAIPRFVDFVEAHRPVICPNLKMVGIAPNMLRPNDSTRAYVEPVALDAARRWRGEGELSLLPPIQLRAAISGAAGRNFAYLEDASIRRLFSDFGDAVAKRL